MLPAKDSLIPLSEISSIKDLPKYWMKAYSIGKEDTLENCYKHYEQSYKHPPAEAWLLTNQENQQILYLKIEEGEER